MSKFNLESEWALLQNQFDSYEKYSLIIKLFAVGVLTLAFTANVVSIFVICLLLILWMQDAIWNTFQARIETRLLALEGALAVFEDDRDMTVCQFNSQYLKTRPGTAGLIVEYFKQAIRPTVAFPHVALVLLSLVQLLILGSV